MSETKGRTEAATIGSVTATTIADGTRSFPPPAGMVKNATPDQVADALEAGGMPRDQVTIHFNPVMLEVGGRRILIDTGYGPEAGSAPNATAGLLPRSLAAAGIDPASIDTIVISHFHGDHINGLLQADGTPAFPGKTVLVPQPEWDFWMDDAKAKAAPEALASSFAAARKTFGALGHLVRRYDWGDQVVPGVTAVATPGHTPGHTSFLVETGADPLFIQSDLTNNPALFLVHPGWHVGFDMDGDQAEAIRRDMLDRAAAENWIVQGFHFPFPGRGRVEKTSDGYRLRDV